MRDWLVQGKQEAKWGSGRVHVLVPEELYPKSAFHNIMASPSTHETSSSGCPQAHKRPYKVPFPKPGDSPTKGGEGWQGELSFPLQVR